MGPGYDRVGHEPSGKGSKQMSVYVPASGDLFTCASPQRYGQRLARLAAVLDPFTRRRLTEAGIRTGSRCLEVGAGSGSVAVWMAERVAPGGQVVVADVDISQLRGHPDIRWVEHDITTDPLGMLPGGGFDIVHARLVLSHVAGRLAVVNRLAGALAPGGALVVEEFDGGWNRYVIQTPDREAYRLFADYHEAMTEVLEAAGKDLDWEVFTAMGEAGLTDMDCQMWSRAWRGGQPGCLLLRDTIELEPLRERLIEVGMSQQTLDALGRLLADPELVIYIHPATSTIGYSPGGRR